MRPSDYESLAAVCTAREVTHGPQVKRSPCGKCKYRKVDKNLCRTFEDCPIHIKTLLDPRTTYGKKANTKVAGDRAVCKFPGCNSLVECNGYCHNCNATVKLRARRFVKMTGRQPDERFLHLPLKRASKSLFATYVELYGVEP